MDVVESAARLFERLPQFQKFVRPGLSDEELAALANFHNMQLPEEVRRFYGAYNFATVTGEDKALFYGDNWMLGLQQALIKKQMIGELAAEFFSDMAGSGEWLPLMQALDASSQQQNYLIDCFAGVRSSAGLAPVLYMYSGAEPEPRFTSLSAMFSTFYDWLDEAVLVVENGRISASDRAERKKMATVAVRHNPDIDYWRDWLD